MLKNKSIDYIFGMITGISVSITFWACTNTDLLASKDGASNETGDIQETGAVQEVKITNWGDMPSVTISGTPTVQFSSLGNDVEINGSIDCNVDFPSSMDVKVTNDPTVKIHSTYNDVDCDIDDTPAIKVDCDMGFGSLDVNVTNDPTVKIHSTYNDVDCDIDDTPAIKVDVQDMPYGCCP